jgi:hypothetical protein
MKVRAIHKARQYNPAMLARARRVLRVRGLRGRLAPGASGFKIDQFFQEMVNVLLYGMEADPHSYWGRMDPYSLDGAAVLITQCTTQSHAFQAALCTLDHDKVMRAMLGLCLMKPGLDKTTQRRGLQLLITPRTSGVAICHWAHMNYPRKGL